MTAQPAATPSLVNAQAAVAGATAAPMQVAGQPQQGLQQPTPQTAPGTLPQPISTIQLPNQQGAGATPQLPQAGAAPGAVGMAGLQPQLQVGQQAQGAQAQALATGQALPGAQAVPGAAVQSAMQPQQMQAGMPGQQPGQPDPQQQQQQQQRSAPPAWYREDDHKETRKKMVHFIFVPLSCPPSPSSPALSPSSRS